MVHWVTEREKRVQQALSEAISRVIFLDRARRAPVGRALPDELLERLKELKSEDLASIRLDYLYPPQKPRG